MTSSPSLRQIASFVHRSTTTANRCNASASSADSVSNKNSTPAVNQLRSPSTSTPQRRSSMTSPANTASHWRKRKTGPDGATNTAPRALGQEVARPGINIPAHPK